MFHTLELTLFLQILMFVYVIEISPHNIALPGVHNINLFLTWQLVGEPLTTFQSILVNKHLYKKGRPTRTTIVECIQYMINCYGVTNHIHR